MEFTSHDHALHRQQRLQKVLHIATEVCGITPDQADALITGLHDDRGTLRVFWVHNPSQQQRTAFAVAWRLVGEASNRVEHSVGV